jgi:hypothetical protein
MWGKGRGSISAFSDHGVLRSMHKTASDKTESALFTLY